MGTAAGRHRQLRAGADPRLTSAVPTVLFHGVAAGWNLETYLRIPTTPAMRRREAAAEKDKSRITAAAPRPRLYGRGRDRRCGGDLPLAVEALQRRVAAAAGARRTAALNSASGTPKVAATSSGFARLPKFLEPDRWWLPLAEAR